jgi:putative ABC transport system permease protein
MFRHLAIAALRNMAANQLQSAIAIIGLSIGIAAALLMGLVVRNQLTYDHFIPGHERTYLLVSKSMPPSAAPRYNDGTEANLADLIKLNVPEVETLTRLMQPPPNALEEKTVEFRRGQISAQETLYWADPNVFDILPQPVYRGDLATALKQPGRIVLPRAIARKYFGRDDVLGETILVSGSPMKVWAIIEDLPANGTSLKSGIFASGVSASSPLATFRLSPNLLRLDTFTFIRLKPGTDIAAVESRLPALVKQLRARFAAFDTPGAPSTYAIVPVRLDRLPLFEGLHPGAQTRVSVAALVGLLVLFIAAVNFVNLLTARAAVGSRLACARSAAPTVLISSCNFLASLFSQSCSLRALRWRWPNGYCRPPTLFLPRA